MSQPTPLKKRSIIVYLMTVALSVALLWAGNQLASTNMPSFEKDGQAPIPQKAVVTMLGAKTEVTHELGGEEHVWGHNLSFHAKMLSGSLKGERVVAVQNFDPYFQVQLKDVEVGDRILLFPNEDETIPGDWLMGEYVRTDALLWLCMAFFICLLIFGRIKGLNTILSLAFTCMAIFWVFVPAVLSGKNIYLWSIGVCIFIIAMTLLIVNGPDRKSLGSALGCCAGVLTAGGLTLLMDSFLQLTGMVDEESLYLVYLNPDHLIDLKAIVFAAIIIGAVGAIMDVAMSLASALMELQAKVPDATVGMLFRSGLSIGRDIMGTMANTLVLAYIGSSLSVVLLLIAYNTSLLYLLNREMIVVEILQALVGSFGILLAIPLTSFICALLIGRRPAPGDGGKKPEPAEPWEDLPPLSPVKD